MYKLTQRRLDQAQDILEKYRARLYRMGCFEPMRFANEMRYNLGLGYPSVQDIVLDIFENHPRYRYVAAFFMAFSNVPEPVTEFQAALAELYHEPYYDVRDQDGLHRGFWNAFNSDEARTLRRRIDGFRAKPSDEARSRQIETFCIRLHELTGEEH